MPDPADGAPSPSASQLSGVTIRTQNSITTSLNYPTLSNSDSESVRRFLRKYDQYVTEVDARHCQIAPAESTEPARPVALKFCVDSEWILSVLAMGLIKSTAGNKVDSYEALTDEDLRVFLDKKAEASKETITLSTLDAVVSRTLRMDMTDRSATSRMEALFVSYHSLLRQHGLNWILQDAPKVAVQHVLSQIRPASLQSRLNDDLDLSHYSLRKDFQGFFAHATKLAEAFQLVDDGPRKRRNQGELPNSSSDGGGVGRPRNSGSGSRTSRNRSSLSETNVTTTSSSKPKTKKTPPPCPHPACQERLPEDDRLHFINDCDWATKEQKSQYKADYRKKKADKAAAAAAALVADPISSRTPSKTGERKSYGGVSRIGNKKNNCNGAVQAILFDGEVSLRTVARFDDGSDETLICPTVAEKAAMMGIGRIRAIKPVVLKVALQKEDQTCEFTFSRTFEVASTTLQLRVGSMALKNISYLIVDDKMTGEHILIGSPVLQHLRIDTSTLLEQNRDNLDGTDCAELGNPTTDMTSGYVSRLMTSITQFGTAPDKTHDTPALKQSFNLDPSRPRVNCLEARKDDDPFPDPALLDPVDIDQSDEVMNAVTEMLQQAKDNGLKDDHHDKLASIVHEHIDVFRTRLSSGPPADIPPLEIRLTPDAVPIKAKLRNYSQSQREFLATFTDSLCQKGMAYPNPTASWASAPLLVPKPGLVQWRFTADLRGVNKYTLKHAYLMPNLENELHSLQGSTCYSNFDLSHAYWQLPLAAESQECQSFVTPDGVFTPTRVLHGSTNAVSHLQSSLSAIFNPIFAKNYLGWLDDILLHAANITNLLKYIEIFLKKCKKHKLKLHPMKCILFGRSVRWCGRIINTKGTRFDPKRLEGLLSMETPTTGAHLQQFVCAMQWVRTAIPEFANLTAALHEVMELVYDRAGKRTKRAVAKIQLEAVGWSEKHTEHFEQCKAALAHQCTLTHRDPSKRLCLYTDASDGVWSGIITQVPYAELSLPHEEQNHEPLAFMSGRFDCAQMGWAILEKEAYAVMASCERMRWLLATPHGFNLYTDHNNLIFIFDPLCLIPDLSLGSVKKVLRWAVSLSTFDFVCYHIAGTDNVWADLLGRWSAPPLIRRLISIPPLVSTSDKDFEWPSESETQSEQTKHIKSKPEGLSKIQGLWRDASNAVWIPAESDDLQLRICIIGHTSAAGHRGAKTTADAILKHYFWNTVVSDARTFVQQCIHCFSTARGTREPRPFGPAFHGTKANDLLQFNYLEMITSATGFKYFLLLRDDFSSYVWLFPFEAANSENAAQAILEWSSAFSPPAALMSDGGSHFQNETVRLVTRGLKAEHHFTLPYTPWSNGGIERVNKEVLRIFRTLLSELRMDHTEWPDLIQTVQSALNHSASPQRKGLSPMTIFTGQEAESPVSAIQRASTGTILTLTQAQEELFLNFDEAQKRLQELHPVVATTLQANRERARQAAKRGSLPRFAEGDFVLVARDELFKGEKLALRWTGPRRVIKALSDFVFTVEDLRNGTTDDIHACRLRFYCDKALNTDAILPHVLSSERGMPVERLMGIEDHEGKLFVHVRWRGLPHSDDSLEPLELVYQDVPKLVSKLLARKSLSKAIVIRAKQALKLTSDRGV